MVLKIGRGWVRFDKRLDKGPPPGKIHMWEIMLKHGNEEKPTS